MSKRVRSTKTKRGGAPITGFMGPLPCELWQWQIWPHCSVHRFLVPVSKAWMALAQASIRVLAPTHMPYTKKMQTLTRASFERFTALERLVISCDAMRLASVMPALSQLRHLHTLHMTTALNFVSQLETLGRLTQLTALDLDVYASASIMPYTTALCQLRLLNVARCEARFTLSHLTALTYLDAQYGVVETQQLTALRSLQYLSLCGSTCTSYAPLSALTRLTMLDLDYSTTALKDYVPVRSLPSTLTSLSIVHAAAMPTDVLTLTQLRMLTFGDPFGAMLRVLHDVRSTPFTLAALDAVPVRQHLPATRLVYGELVLAGQVPPSVARHGLEMARDIHLRDQLNAFRGWLHPLPLNYFDDNGSFIP